MSTALIGYTGFVGGTLLRHTRFDSHYSSRNIATIEGKHFDLIVCAGAPAVKWLANQKPIEDLANLERLMEHLENVTADRFVLISTVDVYKQAVGVNEETSIVPLDVEPYGRHRYYLESFVMNTFASYNIVRLPGLFAPGLKKNFIYDLMYDNCPNLTHKDSVFQFYNSEFLWRDLAKVIQNDIPLINFATEPVKASDIASRCFNVQFNNTTDKAPANYDMRTIYGHLFRSSTDYLYSKTEVLDQISDFVAQERVLVK